MEQVAGQLTFSFGTAKNISTMNRFLAGNKYLEYLKARDRACNVKLTVLCSARKKIRWIILRKKDV